MQIVSFPPALIYAYLADLRRMLTDGAIAEGAYFREQAGAFVPGKRSIPVASGGAAIFALLAYHKHVGKRRVALVQSNTMRALYTVPKLLDFGVQVVDSSYEDFMSMSPGALEQVLESPGMRESAVVIYSVIGGFLAPSFTRIAALCRRAGVPLIVDGAHAHYLSALLAEPDVDIAYSFYATKILPAGEGGLITTDHDERHDWLRRFLIYDRFSNELEVGLNLRASELSAALIHRLMTDATAIEHFKTARVRIAEVYRGVCEARGIRYLDARQAADYNGYKFIVLDGLERVKAHRTVLTRLPATSAVFDTDVLGQPTRLPHWCPPTYSTLAALT